jgi:hypothetical protein
MTAKIVRAPWWLDFLYRTLGLSHDTVVRYRISSMVVTFVYNMAKDLGNSCIYTYNIIPVCFFLMMCDPSTGTQSNPFSTVSCLVFSLPQHINPALHVGVLLLHGIPWHSTFTGRFKSDRFGNCDRR